MAIQESKKQTDIEKRLKLLRQQIYGKSSEQTRTTLTTRASEYQITRKSDLPTPRSSDNLSHSEVSFLYQDLFKIGIFATLALGIQLILFFLTRNHVLNLNFFERR